MKAFDKYEALAEFNQISIKMNDSLVSQLKAPSVMANFMQKIYDRGFEDGYGTSSKEIPGTNNEQPSTNNQKSNE